MFDKFDEYMQYLLPSAFKRHKKQNQLLIYCRVIGRLYDSLLQSILRLREETILATCSPEMLEVFGNDYDMPRMQGETNDMYRRRLQMKALVAETAGTQKGILYALASMGYDSCTITPFYLSDPERWAEIRVNIFTPDVDIDNPIGFRCVVAEVAKVKKASTLPHWRFSYPVRIWHTDINSMQAAIRFIMYVQFWGDRCIYNGQNQYDGKLQYDTGRNYKTNTFLTIKMHIYMQEIGRICTYARSQIYNHEHVTAFIYSCYSIMFWDSIWWDMYIASMSRIELYTVQTIQHKHIALHMRIMGKGKATVRYIPGCQIKSALKNKIRMRIYMEITNVNEKIDNVYVETCRNVAFFDGTLKFDGTAKYDALYRKEEVE